MSFASMHAGHLDPDRHNLGGEVPAASTTVLDFFSADNEGECKRPTGKFADCGEWIDFAEFGAAIGSIVEGCDFGTATNILTRADEFTSADIQARIDAVECDAAAIWVYHTVPRDHLERRDRDSRG